MSGENGKTLARVPGVVAQPRFTLELDQADLELLASDLRLAISIRGLRVLVTGVTTPLSDDRERKLLELITKALGN